MLVKGGAEADLVIAELQGRSRLRQQAGQPFLALEQRPCREIFAVEVEQIEQEEHEAGGVAGVRRQLDHAERGDAVGAQSAQFAVEIGLARGQRRDGRRDLRIFMRPVEPVAGEEPHLAAVEPGMHAEAVVFDLMQPLVAVRRFFDELRELRRNPFRQYDGASPARYGARHGGIGMGRVAGRSMRLLYGRFMKRSATAPRSGVCSCPKTGYTGKASAHGTEEIWMATIAGQRAQFTWSLNQYNLAEDAETRAKFAKRMAKYIAAAPVNGFTVDEVTQGQIYPASEVEQYIRNPGADDEDPGITEEQAIKTVEEAVDTADVVHEGDGGGIVYVYGYRCCGDRLKVGSTEANTVQRIAAQITTSTPDKPVLLVEIKTNQCRALERAIQATLETRGRKIRGGGTEWFKATRDEVLAIYQFITQSGGI